MPRRLAVPASAERTEFCIDLDVTVHGSRRQSTYWTPCAGKDDTRPLPTSFLVTRLRSGRLGHHRDSDRSHPRYSRCPSSTCAHLEKYLLHFHILPDLTVLTALFHRAPVRDQDNYAAWVPFSCLFWPSLTECQEGKDGVIWAESAAKVLDLR
jgi:hypothetical protein